MFEQLTAAVQVVNTALEAAANAPPLGQASQVKTRDLYLDELKKFQHILAMLCATGTKTDTDGSQTLVPLEKDQAISGKNIRVLSTLTEEGAFTSLFKEELTKQSIETIQIKKKQFENWMPIKSLLTLAAGDFMETCPDHDELAIVKHTWLKRWGAISAFCKESKGAAAVLQAHIALVRKAVERDLAQKKLDAEKNALKHEMEIHKKKAEDMAKAAQVVVPLPALLKEKVLPTLQVPVTKSEGELNLVVFDKPFVIKASTHLEAWTSHSQCQTLVAKWASSYKKNKTFEATQQIAEPMKDGAPLKETEGLFGKIFELIQSKLLDVSELNANWNKVSWYFATEIGSLVGLAPSSAGMVLCFDPSEVAVSADKPHTSSLAKLKVFLQTATFETMKESGYTLHSCIFEKGDVLYIPSAWMVLETTLDGPLCYGVPGKYYNKALFPLSEVLQQSNGSLAS